VPKNVKKEIRTGSSCACLEVLCNSKAASNRLTLPSAAYFVGYWYEINSFYISYFVFNIRKPQD